MTSPIAEASDTDTQWPSPPRLFSAKGCAWAMLVLVLATSMAVAILVTRQMENELTLAYWNADHAETIGWARPVELLRPELSQAAPQLELYHPGWIDLSEFRDLAYFRRAFLADSNFQSSAPQKLPDAIPAPDKQAWPWVFVRFGQGDATLEAVTIAINVDSYWVGKPESETGIRFNNETGRRISKRLKLISRVPEDPPSQSDPSKS